MFQRSGVPRTNEFPTFGNLFFLVPRRNVDDDSSTTPLCSESNARYDIQRGGTVTGSVCDIVLFRGHAEDNFVLDAIVTVADKRRQLQELFHISVTRNNRSDPFFIVRKISCQNLVISC
ncbi:hypothetical protein ANCCAN_23763 [Ancylostoma caninum]|uniref:Uncharacterized protein n=1 Tax=Ancylostoma caninum TaxID=29170 RepID=A0A368FE55_ANCCA|nr:hypothetical protein ANCCAN_23763 [Ancylostoma caninum]